MVEIRVSGDLQKPIRIHVRRCLEAKGVPMIYIRAIKDMYDGAKTHIRMVGGISKDFPIKIRANVRLEVWRQTLQSKGFMLSRTKTKYLECNFNDAIHEADVEMRLDTQSGEIDSDVTHRIDAALVKWRLASRVLCDKNVQLKLKVVEIRMVRWICRHTKRDKIKNEDIPEKVEVASVVDKIRESNLR
ncbi:hypothetical protein H5410_015171 [Solanum commersonii]|uniref:Uncharacterized protein n=1 Tax=Solanum commersonii TaxID=4109 RepID=A0A9J5ZTC4_SOLCO|nr:hypothetical protein H5410_015171 [Solanum commersonii]